MFKILYRVTENDATEEKMQTLAKFQTADAAWTSNVHAKVVQGDENIVYSWFTINVDRVFLLLVVLVWCFIIISWFTGKFSLIELYELFIDDELIDRNDVQHWCQIIGILLRIWWPQTARS